MIWTTSSSVVAVAGDRLSSKSPSATFPPVQEYKSALKAIRAKCLDCSAGSALEVKVCAVPNCPLFTYRLGKNPNRPKREMTEEQRKAMVERLAKARKRGAAPNQT